jgi:putative transposase
LAGCPPPSRDITSQCAAVQWTKRVGIEALYRKPNISKLAPRHKICPYLLRKLPLNYPNQVWAMDITYISMARGFIYLAAVLDWFTRCVLS